MFTFLIRLYYNYNGDSMKDSSSIMMNITNMNDIKKLKENKQVKYLNLDIINADLEVISYLLENGQKYSYAERIEDKNGYIYVSYDIFKQATLFILEIINIIPTSLSELEIARYLYITIGKNISYDINILPDKNEIFDLKSISTINNLWGSIYHKKGTNTSLSKLYLYLCSFLGINCSTIVTSKLGYIKNLLTIKNRNIIVDITQDIPYIQANFKTKYFIGFNDNLELDKKIGYIKDEYNETKIEKVLRTLDYSDEKIVQNILEKTCKIIDISNIRPIELSMIYSDIFAKYCPNHSIKIHNLYMNNYPNKNHFILIDYNNNYYGFNYSKNTFIEIKEKEILKNIEEQKIGIYLNEKIPFLTSKQNKAIT